MKTVAIIGASNDRRKFGNKAVRAFRHAGWKVYPVNPSGGLIEGEVSYKRLEDIPEPLDRISMYVQPEIGLSLIPELAEYPTTEVFLNPGAESPDLVKALRENHLKPVLECSVVNIGLTPEAFPD